MSPETILLYIFVAVIGGLGAWFTARTTGAKDITNAALVLVEPLRSRVDELEKAVKALEFELRDERSRSDRLEKALEQERHARTVDRRRLGRLERWAKELVAQVLELGGDPVPFESIPEVAAFLPDETSDEQRGG